MRRFVLAASAAVLVQGVICAQTPATAAVSCPDRTPASITSVGTTAARKCQEAIAREGGKFLRKKLVVLSACKLTQPVGTCPRTVDSDKIQLAAVKAKDNIAAVCGADAAQAGLTSSYASGTDDTVISSCMLSQHNVVGEWVVANANGPRTELWPSAPQAEGTQCVKEISKRGRLFVAKALINATACIKKKMKQNTAGDLAPVCVGSFSGGVFVPPTDTATAAKQAALFSLVETKVADKCAFMEFAGLLPTVFACGGANSISELQSCLVCSGWGAVLDAIEQEYSERGSFVAHAAGAIQTAVNAATAGDKLLIGSGDYAEEVSITTDNLSLVGCGGATDNRPRLIPAPIVVNGRGISANGINGLTFQSLSFFAQANDGIRVTLANGVTFRDIIGDGNLVSSYVIFPQTSNNVLVELCKTVRADDAPIYVGQSSTIVVRYNDVRDSVAAIEIENCGNAQVYGNYSTHNTGGLLVFKDGSLPVQLAQCHHVHHNILDANNTPNFGSGTVALVPRGSGLLVISADSTPYHHNISTNHDTFGFAVTDQGFSGFGPPFSVDQDPQDNYIYDNIVTGNAGNPDPILGFGADFMAIALTPLNTLGNCKSNNTFGTEIDPSSLPTCTLPPPSFAGCPAPPVP